MLKKAAHKALWLAKGAALFGGLAVTLALVFGVATAALAAVPGDPFRLGQSNTISNALTTLVGSNDGAAMLKVDNDSSAGGSRALDLRVEPGKQPINVNADAGKATNLDADELDGKDSSAFLQRSTADGSFLPRRTYTEYGGRVTGDTASLTSAVASCDAEDKALSGGYSFDQRINGFEFVIYSEIVSGDEYTMVWDSTGENPAGAVTPNVTCADFLPLHLTPIEGDVDPGR